MLAVSLSGAVDTYFQKSVSTLSQAVINYAVLLIVGRWCLLSLSPATNAVTQHLPFLVDFAITILAGVVADYTLGIPPSLN